MHRHFRELLDDAKGYSEFVVAANVDIRGFSDFSLWVDSAQTAIYVKKVYGHLLDRYFKDAAFFKPTGDGLLVLTRFEEKTLPVVLGAAVRNALQIVEEFPSITGKEAMINFEVPAAVGIGLARGPASRLATGDETLDYSGRVLNLASRLMDFGRPQGVVVDADFGVPLLPDVLQRRLRQESVFIKGISPKEPHTIFVSEQVQIPTVYTKPLEEYEWESEQIMFLGTVKDLGDSITFRHYLKANVRDPGQIKVDVIHPGITAAKRKHPKLASVRPISFDYGLDAGRPTVSLKTRRTYQALKHDGAKDTWDITVRVSYPKA